MPDAADRYRRLSPRGLARRSVSWLGWWVVLMAIWVAVDDSIGRDELVAGALAAAASATLVEVASYQAGVRYRIKIGWQPRHSEQPEIGRAHV